MQTSFLFKNTLRTFAKKNRERRPFNCSFIYSPTKKNTALAHAMHHVLFIESDIAVFHHLTRKGLVPGEPRKYAKREDRKSGGVNYDFVARSQL